MPCQRNLTLTIVTPGTVSIYSRTCIILLIVILQTTLTIVIPTLGKYTSPISVIDRNDANDNHTVFVLYLVTVSFLGRLTYSMVEMTCAALLPWQEQQKYVIQRNLVVIY